MKLDRRGRGGAGGEFSPGTADCAALRAFGPRNLSRSGKFAPLPAAERRARTPDSGTAAAGPSARQTSGPRG